MIARARPDEVCERTGATDDTPLVTAAVDSAGNIQPGAQGGSRRGLLARVRRALSKKPIACWLGFHDVEFDEDGPYDLIARCKRCPHTEIRTLAGGGW